MTTFFECSCLLSWIESNIININFLEYIVLQKACIALAFLTRRIVFCIKLLHGCGLCSEQFDVDFELILHQAECLKLSF